jgi:hypothetical protein
VIFIYLTVRVVRDYGLVRRFDLDDEPVREPFLEHPELLDAVDRLYMERRAIRRHLLSRRAWLDDTTPEELMEPVDLWIHHGVEAARERAQDDRDVRGPELDRAISALAGGRVGLEEERFEGPDDFLAELGEP